LAVLGDSGVAASSSATSGFQANGFITQMNRQTGQRLLFDHSRNFGIGGNTTLMAEARTIPMLATGAGVCIIAVGGNDVGSGVTATQTLTAMHRMKAQARAAKVVVIFLVPAPRGNNTWPAARKSGADLTNIQTVRTRMLAELPGLGCYVVDNNPHLLAPGTDNDVREGYTYDGLHPNTTGAHYYALTLAGMVNSVIPPLQVTPLVENAWSGSNPTGSASVNPLMTGTSGSLGGGGVGQIATGYSGTNSSGATGVTRTYSKVNKNGKDWQQIVLGGTTATVSGAATELLRQVSLQTKVTPGLTYEVVAEYEHDANLTNVMSIQIGFQLSQPGGVTSLWDGDRYTDVVPAIAAAGIARSPRFVMPADAIDLRMRAVCVLTTTGGPTGTIRITGLELRPVP
jgi:lysophospholipase L1-like esterase